MEESFAKILNYVGIIPSIIYNVFVIFTLFLLISEKTRYTNCLLLYEWNESIFYISPLCFFKTITLLSLAKKIDSKYEKCSVYMIFANYSINWVLSVVFIIGFSELYKENHSEKDCKTLQGFDMVYIVSEIIQVIIITLFGFYLFYSYVKKRMDTRFTKIPEANEMETV